MQSVVQYARLVRPDQPTGGTCARVLDVGTGTSPIPFILAERERFTRVEGTDWSTRACRYMSERAAARGLADRLQYRQADGRRLDAIYSADSIDILLDKGCLDCFVSGRGHADIVVYLAQLRRLIAPPSGKLLLLPVNGAHIPTLLATGAVVREAHMRQAATDDEPAARFAACHALPPADVAALEDAAWKQHCGEGVAGGRGKAWEQQLFIERVVAMEEKHLFVCGLQPLPDGEPALECGACGRCHASAGYPDRCGCGCKLARWCLS